MLSCTCLTLLTKYLHRNFVLAAHLQRLRPRAARHTLAFTGLPQPIQHHAIVGRVTTRALSRLAVAARDAPVHQQLRKLSDSRADKSAAQQQQEQQQQKLVRPAALPQLTVDEQEQLQRGERVQRQVRHGGAGSGLVVVDVRAQPATVMEVLQSYRAYTVSSSNTRITHSCATSVYRGVTVCA
jgi:hypothetical protein